MECRAKGCDRVLKSENGRRQHETRSHDDPVVPYYDPYVLEELYTKRKWALSEIADFFDVHKHSVQRAVNDCDIETRNAGGTEPDAPHKDKELMKELYLEKGLGTKRIGDRMGVDRNTVYYWLKKHDIEIRSHEDSISRVGVRYATATNGYPQWEVNTGDEHKWVKVHTLLAISKGVDPEYVFKDDTVVHHKNGHRFDNRPSNIEVMTNREHRMLHIRKSREESLQK